MAGQKEGKLGATEERTVPFSYPICGPGKGVVSCLEVRLGEGGRMQSVQCLHIELWPHIKAWEHELILVLLKLDPFLPREVQQPQPLAPWTAAGEPGAPLGRADFPCSRSRQTLVTVF